MYYYLQESFIGQNHIQCSKQEYYRRLNQGLPVMIYNEVIEDNNVIRESFEYSVEIPMLMPNLKMPNQ